MTSRDRLLAVLHGKIPDCVPCCPDISNMVPCRLTGKPFWDIYAFQDPPLWKAHIDALKHFDIDGGFEIYSFGTVDPVTGHESPMDERVVWRYDDGRFVTQGFNRDSENCSERGFATEIPMNPHLPGGNGACFRAYRADLGP